MVRIRRIWLAVVMLAVGASMSLDAPGARPSPAWPAGVPRTLLAQVGVPTTGPAAPTAAPTPSPAPGMSGVSHAGSSPSTSIVSSGARVAIIRIDGVIGLYTLESVKRRMDRAIKGGASLLVFELDTPGGEILPAMEIAREIKAAPVPTLAWVNHNAYSAGTLLATACQEIVMAPRSAMGDCAPIVPGQNLAPTERQKALTPWLTEFRDNARKNGYPYCVLQAMCMLGVDVYEVRNPHTGATRLVNQGDYRVMVNGEPIATVNGVPPGGAGATPGAAAGTGPQDPLAVLVDTATPADQGQWELVRQVHNGQSLMAVSDTEALELGLSKALVSSDQELQDFTRASVVSRVEPEWGEGVAWWLTLPGVRAILLMVMLMGVWLEFHAPGTMIGAVAAAVALVLLIVPPLVVGMTQVWHLGLVAAGLVLLVLEILPPPTFGVLAVLGLVMMLVGLVLAAVPTTGSGPFQLPAPEAWGRLQQSIIYMLLAFMGSCAGFVYISRHFGRMPMLNRLVLQGATGPTLDGGAVAAMSGGEAVGSGRITVGTEGSAVSQLRPSGRAEFNGQIVDVVSLGSWIGPGRRVRVVEVQGNRIVVDDAEA